MLEGFDLSYNKDSLGELLMASVKELPMEKPRFIHGLQSPGKHTISVYTVDTV